MNNVHYLQEREVLIIHARLIDTSGGTHGLRDVGLFKSILEKPKLVLQDKEVYMSLFLKAAVYFESFAQFHVFVDGNKRTAIASALRFLYNNGFLLNIEEGELEPFVIRAIVEKWDIYKIAEWFEIKSVARA
jgi:death on curing protein